MGKQNEAFAVQTAKSEASTTKQFDQIGILITTMNKAMDDKVADIKLAISGINTIIASLNGRSKGIGDGVGWIFAGVSLLIAATALFLRHV